MYINTPPHFLFRPTRFCLSLSSSIRLSTRFRQLCGLALDWLEEPSCPLHGCRDRDKLRQRCADDDPSAHCTWPEETRLCGWGERTRTRKCRFTRRWAELLGFPEYFRTRDFFARTAKAADMREATVGLLADHMPVWRSSYR